MVRSARAGGTPPGIRGPPALEPFEADLSRAMKTHLASLAILAGFLVQGQSPVKPKSDVAKSPAQLEKERIEREIQGVWELFEYVDPQTFDVVKASGYMTLFQGWMTLNVVVTQSNTNLRLTKNDVFGSVRRYEVTDQRRLRLTTVWGYYNEVFNLAREPAGTVDERQIVITGPPGPGQRLRLARSGNESMSFFRRTQTLPAPAEPSEER